MAKANLRHANLCEADLSGIPETLIEQLAEAILALLELVQTIEMGKMIFLMPT